MDDDVGLLHEVAHVVEQRNIGLVVPLFQMSGTAQHFGEHGIFVDSPVLHPALSSPYNLLMLLESAVQEVNLKPKGVFLHVLVIVCEIDVVRDRFVVHGKAQSLSKRLRKRCFTGTNEPGYSNKDSLHAHVVHHTASWVAKHGLGN